MTDNKQDDAGWTNVQSAYAPLPFVAPKKPEGLVGPLSQAWDYLVNCGGVCYVDQFDDDFAPAGPAIREKLTRFGAQHSTSGKTTIIFI